MIWQRGAVQSSDFDDNGQFDENMASMAKIRQSIIFKANEMAKVPLKKAILTKMANLGKIRLCDFLQIRHCGNFWT